MQSAMYRQDLFADNLANTGTSGFKVSRMATSTAVTTGLDAPEKAWRQQELQRADELFIDWRQGELLQTGNNLDLALQGDGFFVVDTPAGPAYSRTLSMRVSATGTLTDPTGSAVVTTEGEPIQVKNVNALRIDPNGAVMSGNDVIGHVKVVDFPKPYQLRQEGAGRFVPFASAPSEPVPLPVDASENTSVEQGFVEGPNVNVVAEMVRMISQFRNYEADSKVMHAVDSTLDRAINQVGRV
jgi:flagellar basal-body rod protein FlgG